jgi:glutamate-5-semialdehyde dehydrogenase
MTRIEQLDNLVAGTMVLLGSDSYVRVSEELAAEFRSGDGLAVVPETGEVLHIPARERALAHEAVSRARQAFQEMASVSNESIRRFYDDFATALESERVWQGIAEVNAVDVTDARSRGRSTTRLVADQELRCAMIEGLRGWIEAPTRRGRAVETVRHDGFRVELVGGALGVVAFVFEGRPNVLADACGVLGSGNTVVFRIGSDALRTAREIVKTALEPAIVSSGLPAGAVTLLESAAHCAGWALFSDERLSLAVARGSGGAVRTLGSLAKRAGVAVSLHGTGGAWMVAAQSADLEAFHRAVVGSLDRKVCNTLNTCCIVARSQADLVPRFLGALEEAGRNRGQAFKLHVVEGSESAVPAGMFSETILVRRAQGDVEEARAELLPASRLGVEWEWEETPEVSLVIVDSVDEAVALFNRHSPLFAGSLISDDEVEQQRFYETLDAPFIGDGYTRWVDGQFALGRPELGLSNWQNGRLLGRGAILSGDSVFTLRTRYRSESG